MSTTTVAYDQYLLELLATPPDSFDHRIAVEVATCPTTDALLTLLLPMYLQDPPGTHEFVIAAHLLSLLISAELTR